MVGTFDWMEGKSPVPNRRMGLVRPGLDCGAVSANGVYLMYNENNDRDNRYIVFMDNDSNQIVKLCGRPDCEHNNSDCNAYVDGLGYISYYGGYLYAITGTDESPSSDTQRSLIRMDPDGSNRKTVLDLTAFSKEHGGDYASCDLLTNGVLFFHTVHWVKYDTGDPNSTGIKGESLDWYYYKLDGSMEEPQILCSGAIMLYNCGNVLLGYTTESQNGGQYGSYLAWDPNTNSLTHLTDHPGAPGYYDENQGFYYLDGAIHRLTYATGQDEVMVETGLEQDYFLHAFPECLMLIPRTSGENADRNLYFYNWSFDLIDTVALDYTYNTSAERLLLAETAERIILSDTAGGNPLYYIEKAELGTGEAKVHPFVYSD